MKSLKEAIDEFDDWDDEEDTIADERGDIEYDDYGDGNIEGTGNIDDYVNDADEDTLDSMGMSDHDEAVEDWFRTLNSDEDEGDEDEGDEADQWLSAHESMESLNAKEAKLREALRAVRNAKLKLSK